MNLFSRLFGVKKNVKAGQAIGSRARLHVESLEERCVPAVDAFSYFQPEMSMAAGDVNGDGSADLIVGAGPGAPGGHVKVFDGRSGAEIASFFAFDRAFAGGVNVAAGDVNGDGRADIIAGTATDASHVKVFDGATGAEIRSFLAFPGFVGGVRVAAADLNGDGCDDVIVGAVVTGHVKVIDGGNWHELGPAFEINDFSFGAENPTTTDSAGAGRATFTEFTVKKQTDSASPSLSESTPGPEDANATAVSGRITGIAVDPTDPDTIYIGSANGGVWKTTEGF